MSLPFFAHHLIDDRNPRKPESPLRLLRIPIRVLIIIMIPLVPYDPSLLQKMILHIAKNLTPLFDSNNIIRVNQRKQRKINKLPPRLTREQTVKCLPAGSNIPAGNLDTSIFLYSLETCNTRPHRRRMNLLILLPHTAIWIAPIHNRPKIINKLLDNPPLILTLDDLYSILTLKFADTKQDSSHSIMLLIPPVIPELIKRMRMIPRMDILMLMLWLPPNSTINLILMLQKNIQKRPVSLLHSLKITDRNKSKTLIKIVTQPRLIIPCPRLFSGRSKKPAAIL